MALRCGTNAALRVIGNRNGLPNGIRDRYRAMYGGTAMNSQFFSHGRRHLRANIVRRRCAVLVLTGLFTSHVALADSRQAFSRDTTPPRLVFTVQPVTTAPNGTITPAIEVTIQDSAGHTVTSFTAMRLVVTLKITDGTGNEDAELSGTKSVAAVRGVARFSDLAIDEPGTGYTFTASAPGLASATSAAFDIAAGGATASASGSTPVAGTATTADTAGAAVAIPIDSTKHLVFTVQPSSAGMEATISPAITVTVQDDSGRAVADFAGEVTLAITDGTGNAEAELVGTTTVAAAGGVATFADLNVDEPGTGFTLTATAPGLAVSMSGPFDVNRVVDATMHLVFTVQPTNTGAGAAMNPAVIVTVQDSSGRTASGFTGEVTLELTEGTGSEDAELTGMTVHAVGGVATFTELRVDLEADGYTLTATATGLPDAASGAFNVTAGARPMLRATTFSSGFTLDGKLDEPGWASADSIVNLVTIEPEEHAAPAGQTIVKVLVDASEIIIGVVCRDTNPAGIVSFSRARDADLETEDHVLIVLDPFQDGRSGYVFAVNPSGARFDGLVSAQGEEVNSDWDAVWEAKTWRDDTGWSAEIRIPIRSLSYQKGLTGWGFNVQRRVQRLQETSRWWGISRDFEVYQTSRAGLLTELPQFNFGAGLSIRPAVVGSNSRPSRGDPREYTGDVSLDVTKKLGPNLLGSVTINTDFAETESDARQTNLTRFDVLFPEKRSFFLEGSDIFEFGLGLDEANLLPFFSRRIGLLNPEEGESGKIPIIGGTKLNGRIGTTSLGALVMRTNSTSEDSLSVPATTMGAIRIRKDVLDESSIGMIATFGDPLGRGGSRLLGVDATYRTSQFLGDKTFLVGVWGMRNDRDDLVEGSKNAYGFRIDYPNDLLGFGLTSITIGEAVQPSLGFAPRTGVRVWEGGIDFNPRPTWKLVRQMFHELGAVLYTDLDNRWETFEVKINPLDWQLESGDRVTFKILPQGDRPPEDFAVFESPTTTVTIPVGSYQWTRYSFTLGLAEKRPVSGELTYAVGDFYDGNLTTFEASLAIRPTSIVSLELNGERNSASLPDGDFTQYLYGIRAEVKPSADLQVSSLIQYDNESRSFGTNTRMRWTFHPLGDLFVVFNHNMVRTLGNRFAFESNQLLVKAQYAYRL